MILCIDRVAAPEGITGVIRNVASDSLLTRESVKSIRSHSGPVLIYSADPALSARFWMLLSQMGCRNIYILTNNPDNEVLKYRLQQDTLPGTDLQ